MKNYYLILGVNETADLKKIKKAYRDIAKVSHPDVSKNSKNSDKFKEIKEAYDTLSDTEKRRSYDDRLKKERIIVPKQKKTKNRIIEKNESRNMRPSGFFSYADEIIRNCFSNHVHDTFIPVNNIQYEIILTPEEALAGVVCPISFPVYKHCQRCSGSGEEDIFICPICDGTGQILTKREFSLSIPKGVANGTKYILSFSEVGLEDIYFSVLVLVR